MADIATGAIAAPSPAPQAAPQTGGHSEGATAPADAQSRIAALRKDADFSARYLKGDAAARDEMTRLHALAYPERGGDAAASGPRNETSGAPQPGGFPAEPANPDERESHAMMAGYYIAGALEEESGAALDHGTAKFYGSMLSKALANPPTAAEVQQRGEETKRSLDMAYPGKFDKIIEDARAELAHLTASIPQLPAWLERTGGGNDLHVILQLWKRHADRAQARILKGIKGRA